MTIFGIEDMMDFLDYVDFDYDIKITKPESSVTYLKLQVMEFCWDFTMLEVDNDTIIFQCGHRELARFFYKPSIRKIRDEKIDMLLL